MKYKKVKKYRSPGYPTKEEYMSDPKNLNNDIPQTWKKNKLLLSLLTIFVLSSNSMPKNKIQHNRIEKLQPLKKTAKENGEFNKLKNANLPLVAPIFIHGEGRGAIGCVVINPPAFLNEEEARQIIEEELLKKNIVFDKKNYKVDEAIFSHKGTFMEDKPDTVELDAYSTEYNLGYEFISTDDYYKFGGEWSGSSVTDYDLREAAEKLREKMKQYGKINTIIFYDPIERNNNEKGKRLGYNYALRYNIDIKNSIEEKKPTNDNSFKRKSIESLKRQIADFIEWAEKEKIIIKK